MHVTNYVCRYPRFDKEATGEESASEDQTGRFTAAPVDTPETTTMPVLTLWMRQIHICK